jgi:hypothetical protein
MRGYYPVDETIGMPELLSDPEYPRPIVCSGCGHPQDVGIYANIVQIGEVHVHQCKQCGRMLRLIRRAPSGDAAEDARQRRAEELIQARIGRQ